MVVISLGGLICQICDQLLVEPLQSHEHLFCRRCADQSSISGGGIGVNDEVKMTCPNKGCHRVDITRSLKDANPLLYKMYVPNVIQHLKILLLVNVPLWNRLASLRVNCPLYANDGCTWQGRHQLLPSQHHWLGSYLIGQYDGMQAHLRQQCDYLPLACDFCKQSYERAKLIDHRPECNERLIPCDYCTLEFPFSGLFQHKATCIDRPVTCDILRPGKQTARIGNGPVELILPRFCCRYR
jgi:hypothetical protein